MPKYNDFNLDLQTDDLGEEIQSYGYTSDADGCLISHGYEKTCVANCPMEM